MLSKLKLEYVESAWIICNQLTINDPELLSESITLFQKNLKFVLEKFSSKNLIFSGLFDAHTERQLIKRLQPISNFKITNGFHNFQYSTFGRMNDFEKDVIDDMHKFQANNSNFVLLNDVSPTIIAENGEKIFVDDLVEHFGMNSGKKLKDGIKIVKKIKSSTKFIPILYGKNEEQINQYSKSLLSQINKSDLGFVAALACESGANNFESLNNFLIVQHLDIPTSLKKHTHLLNLMDLNNIAPILTLIRNGLTPNIERLSFDTNLHTSSYIYGKIQQSSEHIKNFTKISRLGLNKNHNVKIRFTELIDFWKDSDTFNFVDLEDVFKHSIYDSEGINSPTKQLKERNNSDYLKNVNLIQMYILFNIFKYLSTIFDFIEDKIGFYDLFRNDKFVTMYNGLANITSMDEYYDWLKLASNKYRLQSTASVQSLKDLKNDPTVLLF